MGSAFKKIIKRASPNLKRLTPQFVKNNETLSKYRDLNVVTRVASTQAAVNRSPDWGDTKAVRGILREKHELGTTPWSGTADKIRQRDAMPYGTDRDQLTREINAKTLRRGSIGISVAGVAVGASAVGSAASRVAGSTGAQASPADPYEYSRIVDPVEIYSGDPGSQTASAARQPAPSNAGIWVMGGLLLLKILL